MVDGHVNLSTRGVIQLFSQPHPRKLLPSPYVGRSPPRLPPAEEQLCLPLDYNPVGLLRQLETLSHFHGPTQVDSHDLAAVTIAGRRQRDLQWLVTLAVELFIPERFRLLRQNATLEERWQICQDIIRFDRHLVPRCLRAFIQTVFHNETVTAQGLPPPSAHQLLQPMVSLIPFPSEFPAVLRATRRLRQLFENENMDFSEAGKIISSFSNLSSISLLIPFVKALLLKSSTAFRAALYLLDPIATALGPYETAKEFLHIILKIMGPEQPSAPLVFLYHKRFLLMLQVKQKEKSRPNKEFRCNPNIIHLVFDTGQIRSTLLSAEHFLTCSRRCRRLLQRRWGHRCPTASCCPFHLISVVEFGPT